MSGGLSPAAAIGSTGLAQWLGGGLRALGVYPAVVLVLGLVALVIYLTELTGNTAATAAFLPVVAALAGELGVTPLQLAAPAASCAFIPPVATPVLRNPPVFRVTTATVQGKPHLSSLRNPPVFRVTTASPRVAAAAARKACRSCPSPISWRRPG